MSKLKLATAWLDGCSGCHMSFLDIDERILELVDLVDLDKSPLNDKKAFDGPVDIGLIEGACASEDNVRVLREFREHCRILVSVGACAVNGGVPAMRNECSLAECLDAVYVTGPTVDERGAAPADEDLPRLLDRVEPCHDVVAIDYTVAGCPPAGDAIWDGVKALLAGETPRSPFRRMRRD